jgi:hypothetical protein
MALAHPYRIDAEQLRRGGKLATVAQAPTGRGAPTGAATSERSPATARPFFKPFRAVDQLR